MIIRAEHTDGFLRVMNSAVQDTRISCEACGLLVRMLSLPDDWDFSAEGLSTLFSMSIKTVRRLVKELRAAGYVDFKQNRNDRGFFEASEWLIYEAPIRVAVSGIPDNGITADGIPAIGVPVDGVAVSGIPAKGQLLTTNIQTNKEQTNKEQTTEDKYIPGRGEFLNVYVSDSEFEKLTERFGAQERDSRIEDLSRYLANHPKKKYASHYATILAWARKDQKDARPSSIPQSSSGGIDWDRVAAMAVQQAQGGGT